MIFMQKGFVTLEIILAIMIIGVLMKFAVPKAAQVIDTAALDYETKRFYSELRFVQAMSKSSPTGIKGTGNANLVTAPPILFINRTENYYQVFKSANTFIDKPIREPHYFSNGVTFKLYSGTAPTITIKFDSEGKAKINNNGNSETLVFTSRFGKNKYIRFDSVGRIRGSLNAQ